MTKIAKKTAINNLKIYEMSPIISIKNSYYKKSLSSRLFFVQIYFLSLESGRRKTIFVNAIINPKIPNGIRMNSAIYISL